MGYPNKFKLVGDPIFLTGARGRVGQRFFKFRPLKNSNGLPIVIYSTSSMNLPVQNKAGFETLAGNC